MNVRNAIIRTLTAYVVGAVLAGLVLVQITVPPEGEQALTAFLTIVFANAYYLLVNLLARLPWFDRWIGYLLIIPTEPTYGGHDLLWGFVRTLIPSIVGALLALIPATIIVIDDGVRTTIILTVTTATQAGYYSLVKWLETKPHLRWISLLLGSTPSTQPVYVPKHRA